MVKAVWKGVVVAESDDTWRLFSPYEFVWAGGKLGRAVQPLHHD